MKKLIFIAFLIVGTTINAQNNDKRFTFGVYTEPAAWKDGLNSSYICRGDAEFYGGDKWMFNGGVKAGYQF